MHAGTITWNGLDLTGLGKPKLGISRQADPPALRGRYGAIAQTVPCLQDETLGAVFTGSA